MHTRAHIVACAIIYPLMCNYKQFFLFVIYNGATKIKTAKRCLFLLLLLLLLLLQWVSVLKLHANCHATIWLVGTRRRMRAAATFVTCLTDKNSSQMPAISWCELLRGAKMSCLTKWCITRKQHTTWHRNKPDAETDSNNCAI